MTVAIMKPLANSSVYFPGTFNPVHLGHVLMAQTALHWLGLSQVIWLPSGAPPHRLQQSQLLAAPHRLAMVQLAIEGLPGHIVNAYEVEPSTPKPSYTFNTLKALVPEGQTPVVLIGQDALASLPTWYNAKALAAWVHWVQVPRVLNGVLSSAEPVAPVQEVVIEGETVPLQSTVLPMPLCPVSATLLRERLQQNLPVAPWCPPAVEAYVKHHHLF